MTISRRSFFAACAGLPVLGHVLQRAPLPSDVPYVQSDNAIGPASDYTVTSGYSHLVAHNATASNVTMTVYGYQKGDDWFVIESGHG